MSEKPTVHEIELGYLSTGLPVSAQTIPAAKWAIDEIDRLRASKSELVEALKGVMRSFHPITMQDNLDYDAARAAIAKATRND